MHSSLIFLQKKESCYKTVQVSVFGEDNWGMYGVISMYLLAGWFGYLLELSVDGMLFQASKTHPEIHRWNLLDDVHCGFYQCELIAENPHSDQNSLDLMASMGEFLDVSHSQLRAAFAGDG